MDKSSLPDLEGYFEPVETEGRHLSGPQQVPEEIAEQQLRKTYWRLSFERVQFGRYLDQYAGELPACLIVVEARFAPEDQERHRFTKVNIGLSFEGEDKGDIKVQRFAPEYARGVTVPGVRTSNWAIRPKMSVSASPIPVSIDILDGEYGHRTSYQVTKTASMQGVKKFGEKVQWNLSEAVEEGIPLRVPSLVVLVSHRPNKPFKFRLKFDIDASIGFSLNPQRWSVVKRLRKKLEPVLLEDTMQRVSLENAVDSDFTSLELQRLTRTNFTNDI